MNAALQQWLLDRPYIIRQLASKYPPGASLQIDGITHYVVSYFEDGSLGVSEIDPTDDYDRAIRESHMLCKDCVAAQFGHGHAGPSEASV
jgi:hypothetical protein